MSNKKTSFPGGAMLSPVPPTLISCGNGETYNALTVAWTGVMCTKPPITYISVRPSRHSHAIIEQTGEFVINLVPESMVSICDACGVKSGKDMDKFQAYGLTAVKADTLRYAPLIDECPVNIECKVLQKMQLGTHDVFMASVERVHVNSNLMDENGKIKLWKAKLIAYAHGSYYTLGKHLGDFGFSVRRKKKR